MSQVVNYTISKKVPRDISKYFCTLLQVHMRYDLRYYGYGDLDDLVLDERQQTHQQYIQLLEKHEGLSTSAKHHTIGIAIVYPALNLF